jgi:hypothetical protein
MFIRHHLAKGFNEIPLKDIRISTEHKEGVNGIEHVGLKVGGAYAGENPRNAAHRYEILFEMDEFSELLRLALRFQAEGRFTDDKLPPMRLEGVQVEDDEDDA